ncbi:hypothetical protein L596_000143 [Steinernema carpocapsae]|nr:hypothetical protein L596_000143 [Steinernema carpocapsae]
MPRLPDGVKMEPYGVEFLGDPGEGQIIFPPDVPEPRPKTRAQLCERVRTGYNPFADATSSRYYVRPSVVEFLEDKLELGVNLTDFINVTPGNVVVFKNIIDSTIKADKKQKEAEEKAEQARAARDKREQELEEYRVRQECRAAAARAKAVAEAEAAARAEVAAEEAARARSSPTGSVCSVDRNASPDSRLSSGGFGHQPPPAPYGHPPAGYGPYGYGPPPPGYAAYPPPPPHGHPPDIRLTDTHPIRTLPTADILHILLMDLLTLLTLHRLLDKLLLELRSLHLTGLHLRRLQFSRFRFERLQLPDLNFELTGLHLRLSLKPMKLLLPSDARLVPSGLTLKMKVFVCQL